MDYATDKSPHNCHKPLWKCEMYISTMLVCIINNWKNDSRNGKKRESKEETGIEDFKAYLRFNHKIYDLCECRHSSLRHEWGFGTDGELWFDGFEGTACALELRLIEFRRNRKWPNNIEPFVCFLDVRINIGNLQNDRNWLQLNSHCFNIADN